MWAARLEKIQIIPKCGTKFTDSIQSLVIMSNGSLQEYESYMYLSFYNEVVIFQLVSWQIKVVESVIWHYKSLVLEHALWLCPTLSDWWLLQQAPHSCHPSAVSGFNYTQPANCLPLQTARANAPILSQLRVLWQQIKRKWKGSDT